MRSTKHLTHTLNHRCFSASRPTQCDVVIIGGGIAGSSVGYELSKNHNLNVIILEQEHYAGYHSTGRAAGLFAEDYGSDSVKLLTIASRKWFENPPLDCNPNITENPILSRLGLLCTSTPQNQSAMIHHFYDNSPCKDQLQLINRHAAKSIFPLLQYENESMVGDQFVYDPNAAALDVANVHASYLKGCRHANVPILCNQKVENIQKSKHSNWHILTDKNEEFECRMIVNAAGAWSDEIALKSGLESMGITPLRRSLILFKPHNGEIAQCLDLHLTNKQSMPWCFGVDDKGSEFWYIGPQGKSGLMLASPANKDLDEAGDTIPDDLDIAICVDRIESFTKCKVQKIESKWAGLRCYSKDENFIIGKDPNDESGTLFWCAGLAGQGIQAAPGYSQFLAAQIAGKGMPECLREVGFNADSISPKRFIIDACK